MDNSQFRVPAMTQPPPDSHQHPYGAHNVSPQFTQQGRPTARSQPGNYRSMHFDEYSYRKRELT